MFTVRNLTFGLILIGGIAIWFSFRNHKSENPQQRQRRGAPVMVLEPFRQRRFEQFAA